MSTEYVPLALIMFAFTYPSRAVGLLAPAIDRLPRPVLDYLQLVGPAVLTALAAVDVMVGVDNGESVFTIGLLSNRLLLAAIVFEIVLLVAFVSVPPFQDVFHTETLDPLAWPFLLIWPVVVFGAEELRKAALRRAAPRR